MSKHWQKFGKKMWSYCRYCLLAPVVALIPFLLNLEYWREHGGLWLGLRSSLVGGTIIGMAIVFLFSTVYAGLTWIATRTGKFYQPPVFINILLGSLGGISGMWIVDFIESFQLGKPVDKPPLLPALILIGIIATVFALFFAYLQAKEESLALRAESAEARYSTLENQMRPHFLFNALNSLAELIESGQENAAEMTYKLSDLYRRILANSGLKTAPIDSEIEIAQSYLELEQLRYGHRLSFSIEAPANSQEIYLPSLMLQTLVENAVKHGIAPSTEGGVIEIEIAPTSAGNTSVPYCIRVTNTGVRYHSQNHKRGTGLANTKGRLDLLYGGRHKFQIESDHNGRTVASFFFTGEKID